MAVVVMATILCAAAILHYGRRQEVELRRGLMRGNKIPQIGAIDYGASPRTIVVLIPKNCQDCKEHQRFYEQLYTACSKRQPAIQVVAVSAESETQVSSFIKDYRLPFAVVSQVSWIDPVPVNSQLIISVDNIGRILDFWQGELSADSQDEIFAAAR